MGKAVKIGGIGVGVLVLLLGGAVGWVETTADFDHPDTPNPSIAVTDDPAVIAEGEYIVHNVAHCSTCHQPAEVTARHELDRSAPLTGGFAWDLGPFGTFYAANITPCEKTGIGRYSDEELARVIRHAVLPDGKLAAFMLLASGPMSDRDLTAVISYLRAQEPVEAAQPRDELGFLAKMISGKMAPRLTEPPGHAARGPEPSVERGEYLANGPAVCSGCHTPVDPLDGFAASGPRFSGVSEAEPDPTSDSHEIVAPNLTPDPETGITGRWSEDQFVARFAAGRSIKGSKMPWEAFQQMDERDVRSIYRYLKTLDPVKNDVGPNRREKGWAPAD